MDNVFRGQFRFLGRVTGGMRPTILTTLSTALLFVGIYTDVPLSFGGGTIPMVSALPGAILLILSRIRILPQLAVFVAVPGVLFFCLAMVGYASTDFIAERINATAQFSYALAIGYLGALAITLQGKRRVNKALSAMLIVFILLIAIEVITPFKDIVSIYLRIYPREYDFLAIADRESTMGGYRPKLFTSETSYVAITSVILVMAYLWSGVNPRRYIKAIVFTFLSVIFIRSPISTLSVLVIIVSVLYDRELGYRKYIYALGSILLAIGAALTLFAIGGDVINDRLARASSGADYSTTYRTYGSLAVGWNVAREYPYFGIGPGSLEPAREIIVGTEFALGVPLNAVLGDWKFSINNALASSLVSFGFIGSIFVFVSAMVFVIVEVPPRRAPAYLGLIILCATSGSIYTPKFTSTFIIIVALAKLRKNDALRKSRDTGASAIMTVTGQTAMRNRDANGR